ncbi:DNA repair REX1-B-domain-containing protein [Ochromonadaceae sp. CCMP2298]|nr:DNA repair REX1-B-domain-containing protein [Ochromonadaceae sp. CCMP2298]
MDFGQCVSILEARQAEGPNPSMQEITRGAARVRAAVVPIADTVSPERAALEALSSLDLVKEFQKRQEERLMIYRYFDSALAEIMEQHAAGRYPAVCAEVTGKFSSISVAINLLKDVLIARQQAEVCLCITRVQEAERHKLMLVAARHLDLLQDSVGELGRITGGKTEQQEKYLQEQITTIEASIVEAMEDTQAVVCDMAEELTS